MTPVMAVPHTLVKQIFLNAVEVLPEHRASFLDHACGEDDDLRHAVEEFLRSHDELGDFLGVPAIARMYEDALVGSEPDASGRVVGRYKLLERIGEGGFGDVYRSEQETPHREVALKIIKLGMNTRQVMARFEAERQALAVMDHVGIAKVFDAGISDSGRPYFVMELVQGVPITEYCDRHQLTIQQRLRLFLNVCGAVQHAHQKGIIHRDIKPTNVLVAHQDGQPIAKVIDFGIAKATKQRLTEKTVFTERGQLIGTPEYMSPEQAAFCDDDVDTRSDIYSLGVMLYELLVGVTPFDAKSLRGRGYDEVCRIIRESEPPMPSQRLSQLAASTESSRCQIEPNQLHTLLRRDLDWVVMKTLEKDRERRYETVDGLAADLKHYLNSEPVIARPPSISYRLKKFVGRHRGVVMACLAILAAITVGGILSAVGFARANHQRNIALAERDRAQENLRLAQQLVSQIIQPATERMSDFPYAQEYQREVLEKARSFYSQVVSQASDDLALIREMAKMHQLIGEAAYNAGQDSLPHFRQSILLLEQIETRLPANADCRRDLRRAYGRCSAALGSDLQLRIAVEQRRYSVRQAEWLDQNNDDHTKNHSATAVVQSELGRRLAGIGSFEEALKWDQEANTSVRTVTPEQRLLIAENSAYLLMRLGRYEDANARLQQAIDLAAAKLTSTSPPDPGWAYRLLRIVSSRRMMALHRFCIGQFEDAESLLLQVVDEAEMRARDFPSGVWVTYVLGQWRRDLSQVQLAMGKQDEAEDSVRTSLGDWQSIADATPLTIALQTSLTHYRLGELLHSSGRIAEAQRQFAEARSRMEFVSRQRPSESVCQWPLLYFLADCPDDEQRDPSRAVELAERVLPPQVGHYWRLLALAQYRAGSWQETANSVQKAMDLRQGGDAYDQILLSMALWQLGERDTSRKIYSKAQEAIAASEPIFYEYVGVMGIRRLEGEAKELLGR